MQVETEKKTKKCKNLCHESQGSKYDREKVPISEFLKDPTDFKSLEYGSCKPCRDEANRKAKDWRKRKRSEPIPDGHFKCVQCYNNLPLAELHNADKDEHIHRFGDKDDTPSQKCKQCHVKFEEQKENARKERQTWKMDHMKKKNTMCERCDCFFIESLDCTTVEVVPVLDGEIQYNGNTYSRKDFMRMSERMSLQVVEFDHLTEKEMRERGKLLPDENFEQKSFNVSRAFCREAFEKEAKKCQMVCGRCHVIATLERNGVQKRTILYEQKMDYVNHLKLLAGCYFCKRKEPTLPQFLEMDHLDESAKITSISKMCGLKEFTMEDFVAECGKCRVVCRFCHRLRTKIQKRQKDFNPSKKQRKIVQNKGKRQNTTSQYTGVSYGKEKAKWRAVVSQIRLGLYDTEAEAINVRDLFVSLYLRGTGYEIQQVDWNDKKQRELVKKYGTYLNSKSSQLTAKDLKVVKK